MFLFIQIFIGANGLILPFYVLYAKDTSHIYFIVKKNDSNNCKGIFFKTARILDKENMKIEILGTESLGVRGLSCFVETKNRKILIDPGIALGYIRHKLLPHPFQIAIGKLYKLSSLPGGLLYESNQGKCSYPVRKERRTFDPW